MKNTSEYTVSTLLVAYFFLLAAITQTEACSRMKYINPLEIEDLDSNNVPLSNIFRSMLGEGIDEIIGREIRKFGNLNVRKKLKNGLEELVGYGMSNPCIVLQTMGASLEGM